MAREAFTEFTAEQEGEVLLLLEDVPYEIGVRGNDLSNRGAVREIWWADPGRRLEGNVQGTKLYTQSVRFGVDEGLAAAECSCLYGYGCKHVVALLLRALEGWPKTATEGLGQPGGEAASRPVTATPPGELLELPPSPLVAYLTKRMGQPLSRTNQNLAAKIEEAWRKGKGTLPEPELLALGGHTSHFYGWRPDAVDVWPSHRPPATAIEAFHYVAHALRERKRLPNHRLFQTVDWAAVDTLVQVWKHEQFVERWRNELLRVSLAPREPPPSSVFRLRLSEDGGDIEWRKPGASEFVPIKQTALRQCLNSALNNSLGGEHALNDAARRFLVAIRSGYEQHPHLPVNSMAFREVLSRLLRQPGFDGSIVSPSGEPVVRDPRPLRWVFREPGRNKSASAAAADDYEAVLQTEDGQDLPPSLVTLDGWPYLYVLPDRVHEIWDPLVLPPQGEPRLSIPAAAIESAAGVAALKSMRVPLPERLAARVQPLPVEVTVRCRLRTPRGETADYFQVSARASGGRQLPEETWTGRTWKTKAAPPRSLPAIAGSGPILSPDRTQQQLAGAWLAEAQLTQVPPDASGDYWNEKRLVGAGLREFPDVFLTWLSRRPDGVHVELDPLLASLRDGKVSGSVRLDAEESGVDWFDLRVSLDVSEIELTPLEIQVLLKAQGRWVRLPDKGWRKLDFQLSEDEHSQLADLGLGVGDLADGEAQRLHVLQLAGAAATRLLPPERVEQVKRRAEELRTSVTPEVPGAITALLRPYQREGYHFLAYLATNRFGGILADDMGLGKTVQTLAWLAWLRQIGQLDGPALVVCPKSVQDNWRAEVARFAPELKVRVWNRESAGALGDPAPEAPPKPSRRKKPAAAPSDDLVIINYTQLRLHEEALRARPWAVVILDEAQYIKNPSSQTAKAACSLQAGHRLALSGTPIENRLLDLWSIMQFAMPGVLGNRTAFARNFNGKDDPLARRRLSARVRPFVLRRTKKEVAKDLPDRIEEEIICELEGPQLTLYRAELKRARAMLLKAKTSSQLDKLRFNILTSLLRLRQICCHPALVGAGKPRDESAKLAALLDVLEPLVEEGHKVLVFSQFVEMLEIIRAEIDRRDWPHLVLTGKTEDRGALVEEFQQTEGASVFLISLKAGGFGLNLTAASYVVLFDPWWNPAVENQAIDRTHRIGQTSKVIAYRLLVRESIEEKIRHLQKQKSTLASDILGEENFAKALTLDDFRFLLGDGGDAAAD